MSTSTKADIGAELKRRIQADIKALNGSLPERYALAWHGYLAGVFEWGLIDIPQYDSLLRFLPPIADPNPIAEIFEGRN